MATLLSPLGADLELVEGAAKLQEDQSTFETEVEGLVGDVAQRTNDVITPLQKAGNGAEVATRNKPQAAKIVGGIAREIGIPADAAKDPTSVPGQILLAMVASVAAALAWTNRDKK